MSTTVMLRYTGTKNDRFDRDYYCSIHMPAVSQKWNKYGLISATEFFLVLLNDEPGTVCICECVFRDEQSMQVAFLAERTKELVSDIKNFTNLCMEPSILVSMNLKTI